MPKDCTLPDSIERRLVQRRWRSQEVKELLGTPVGTDAKEDEVDRAEGSLADT